MSGPKVDTAELRRQELARLEKARRQRLEAVESIKQQMKQLEKTVKVKYSKYGENELTKARYKSIVSKLDEPKAELQKAIEAIQNGNENTDILLYKSMANKAIADFEKSISEDNAIFMQMESSDAKLSETLKNTEKLQNAKVTEITVFKKSSAEKTDEQPEETETVAEGTERFTQVILEKIETRGITSVHKDALLDINQEISAINNSDSADALKLKKLKDLYEDYVSMSRIIDKESEMLCALYDEYLSELFDAPLTAKPISEFHSLEDLEKEIDFVKANAGDRLAHEYIKRQIDEVMALNGYSVVSSELLEKATADGQTIYSVNDDTAINVFVSPANQVTMRVVGIGFDDELTPSENENLFAQQCAFCSMHPKITEQLAMRGVILNAKEHLPPDRKYNKKITERSDNRSGNTERVKKKRQIQNDKIMYKD